MRKVLAFGSSFGWESVFESAEPDVLDVPEPPAWPKGHQPPPDPPMPPVPPRLNTHAATTRPTINPPRTRLILSNELGALLNARLLTSAFTNQPVPKPPTAVAPTMANTRTTNVPTSSIASNEKWPKLILNLRLLVFVLKICS